MLLDAPRSERQPGHLPARRPGIGLYSSIKVKPQRVAMSQGYPSTYGCLVLGR